MSRDGEDFESGYISDDRQLQLFTDRHEFTRVFTKIEELNQARINPKQTAQALELKERTKLLDGLKGNKYTLLKSENQLSQFPNILAR